MSAYLIGTDFNPDGIKGIGPKTALKLINQHGTLEKALPHIKNASFPLNPTAIREDLSASKSHRQLQA